MKYMFTDVLGRIPFYKSIEIVADNVEQALEKVKAVRSIRTYEKFDTYPAGVVYKMTVIDEYGGYNEANSFYVELAKDNPLVVRF